MGRSGAFLFAMMTMAAAEANADGLCHGDAADAAGILTKDLASFLPKGQPYDGALLTLDENDACVAFLTAEDRHVGHALRDAIATARRGRALPASDRVVLYVNGMVNTPEMQCEVLRSIRAATGATVIGVHNQSKGFAADASEVFWQRERIGHEKFGGILDDAPHTKIPSVRTLKRVVMTEVLSGRAPEIWAHSQGAVITSLALFEAEERLREIADRNPGLSRARDLRGVRVTSFASAAPWWPDGPRYEHYLHTDDLVPRWGGLGNSGTFDAKKAGAGAKVIRFSGTMATGFGDAKRVSLPDAAHHDVLRIYIERWRRDHLRPASLIQPDDWQKHGGVR